MSYADHARRYLATLGGSEESAGTHREKSEISEESVGTRDSGEPPSAVWWADSPAAVAPIVWSPPRDCCGPIACSRLGPCDRRITGSPCRVSPAEGT